MKPLGTADLAPGRHGQGPADALADASALVLTPTAARPEQRRFTLAVAVSLALHAALLSLTLGGDWTGVPGLSWPWQERRAEVERLSIFLVPPSTRPEGAAPAAAAVAGPLPAAPPSPPVPVLSMDADTAVTSPLPVTAALGARVLMPELPAL